MLDNNIRLNIVENGTVAVFGWSLTNFRSIMKRTFEDTQLSFLGCGLGVEMGIVTLMTWIYILIGIHPWIIS